MLSQPWQRNASSAAQYHRALTFRQLSHARAVLAPKALASFISLVIELVFGCKDKCKWNGYQQGIITMLRRGKEGVVFVSRDPNDSNSIIGYAET